MNDFQLQMMAANMCKSNSNIMNLKIALINEGVSIDDIDNYVTIINQLMSINSYEKQFGLQITSPEEEKKLTLLKDEEKILKSKYEKDGEMLEKVNIYVYLSHLRTINRFGEYTYDCGNTNPLYKELYHEIELSKQIKTEVEKYSEEIQKKIYDYYSKLNENEQSKSK